VAVLGKLRAARLARAAADALESAQEELVALRRLIHAQREQAAALVEELLDRGRPGAAARGRRLADLAVRLARRLAVPEEFHADLALAARLLEVAKLIPAASADETNGRPGVYPLWRTAAGAQAVLERVEPLAGAAGLIGGAGEHWDGTGRPGHREQGEIPMRSRILRLTADLAEALEREPGRGPLEAWAALAEHGGTYYDPKVLGFLRGQLQGAAEGELTGACRVVPVPELAVGMVVAEDLYTDSGIKLAARDTVLTPATLEIILRRHRFEPLQHGVVVRRGA
jgi:response regulator RpfG family c-di-GMP phosphodiesterase